jgi:UDP-N-acetylglucosamine 2-epimerase (non-hydrolysing)/GDP/UDP-N,N'-diacetylbacillosamine 2-epimerase (hydrolysing)
VSAALHLGIPIAHIQGGDVSGNVDEMMRHAITKMSHIHFPSTQGSAERIIKMGEEPWRVHVVGDPHVDMLMRGKHTPGAEVRKKFSLAGDESFALILVHPETLRPETSYHNMQAVLTTVKQRQLRSIVVWPCSDHGYQGILDAIHEVENDPLFSIYKNIDAPDFWGLQEEASVFIGNSSAGLIEAPYFNLPVINIGLRQIGRERADNCIDVPEVNGSNLDAALDTALSAEFRKQLEDHGSRPFGKGDSAERMVEVLKTVQLGTALFEKRMTY